MRKKLYLWLLCAVCSAFSAAAQGFSVRGVLKDSISGEAQMYASVRLFVPGREKPVAVAASDENGAFRLAVSRAGNYEVVASAIGKENLKRAVSLTRQRPSADLGVLPMNDAGMLATATVTAVRPLVKAEVDKVSYSMADDPEAKTSTLIDMLRKVPMVTVDGDDGIQVNGSSSFKVYVNGKPNEMMSSNPSEIMKNFPASTIRKVEVITDPGAKYDAEGLSGILNIVTDSETRTSGYTFTPNAGISREGYNAGAFLMAQAGKLTLSANYGVRKFSRPTSTSFDERENFTSDAERFLRSRGKTKNRGMFQYGSLSASYEFDEKNLLSVSAGVFGHRNRIASTYIYDMTDIDEMPVYSYMMTDNRRRLHMNYNAGADYQHAFAREDQMLTLSYRFNSSPNTTTDETRYTEIDNVPYDLRDLDTDPDNTSLEHTLQLDFTTPLADSHTLSAGLKQIFRINRSDNVELSRPAGSDDPFVFDADASLRYRHRGSISAAYGEYIYKVEKLTARAGLRYEFSNVRVDYPDGSREAFASNFSDLVPNLSVGYNLSPTQLVKLSYNTRIGRPGITQLSPYVEHITPESESYGNPNLDTETAHNIGLGYSLFAQKFSISANLSHALSNDGIASYSALYDNIMHTTYANCLRSRVTNLNLFLNWGLTSTTQLNINSNFGYSDLRSSLSKDHTSGWNCFAFAGLTQTLPGAVKLRLNGGGGNGRLSLQGKSSGFYFYGLNLSRSFLRDDRLTLSLQARNFLTRWNSRTNERLSETFRSYTSSRDDRMSFGLNVSWKFGSLKAEVKRARRALESDDHDHAAGDDEGGAGEH